MINIEKIGATISVGTVLLLVYCGVNSCNDNDKMITAMEATIEKTFPYEMHQSKDELLLYKRLDKKLGAGSYVLHTCNTEYHPNLRYNFHSTNAVDVSNCEMCDYDLDTEMNFMTH